MRIGQNVLYTMSDGASVRPAVIVAIRERWTVKSASDPRFNLEGVRPLGQSAAHIKAAVLKRASELGAMPPADLATTTTPLGEVDLSVFVAGREDRGLVEHHERSVHGSTEIHPNLVHRRAKQGTVGEAHTWHVDVEPSTLPTGATPATPTANAPSSPAS